MKMSDGNIKTASGKKRKWPKILIISILSVCLILTVLAVLTMNRFRDNFRESVTIEAGDPLPEKKDFLIDDWDWISMDTDISGVNTGIPVTMEVIFSLGPLEKSSLFIVRDTIAPTGEAQDLVSDSNAVLTPEDFVTSYDDITDVRLVFVKAPDMKTEGEQTIEIALEDLGGNRTVLTSKLLVYDPKAAPEINGANDIWIYEGDNISYRKDVTVTDTLDPEPELTIDNSAVNPDKIGTYPVTYKATDCYGRTAVKRITVHVQEPTEDVLNQKKLDELVKDWVGTYISDDMTVIEKSFAVFRWVRLYVPWNNGRTSRDSVEQALRGMQGEVGDCYTHAITCKVLLDAAGVVNMMIQRYPGPGQHYWLLVNVDGDWFHLDPSPIYLSYHICFLQTDAEIEEFGKKVRRYNYYAYDHSKYPSTPLSPPARAVYKNGDYYLEIY